MSSTDFAHGFSRRGFLFQAAALSTGVLYSNALTFNNDPEAARSLYRTDRSLWRI